MTHATRRPFLIAPLAMLAVLAVATCAPGSATPSPSASASASPAASLAASAPPSQAVTTPPSTTVPATTPLPPTACAFLPQYGRLPSDRLTTIEVTAGSDADHLTFRFGDPSLGPGGPTEGTVAAAEPPYTQAGSGAAIEVDGDHVLTVVFRGMSLSNDVGQETYTGPTEVTPDLPALRHAVLYDASEGVMGWYVGYVGGGCPTLTLTTNGVTLTIQHP